MSSEPSHSVGTPWPRAVVAQLPSAHEPPLAGPQSRDHGFLRTKMKVLILTVSLRPRGTRVHMGSCPRDAPK